MNKIVFVQDDDLEKVNDMLMEDLSERWYVKSVHPATSSADSTEYSRVCAYVVLEKKDF